MDSLNERMAAVAKQHASLEERIETMGTRIGEIESTDGRDDEIEALRTELEAVRSEATATPALPSSIIAGGGVRASSPVAPPPSPATVRSELGPPSSDSS